MADAESNWIDFYISLSPVAQTGIWASVAVAALFTLRQPLRQLAEGLVRRVNQGDKVSTPWLSLERRQKRERKVVEQVAENIRTELHPSEGAERSQKSSVSEVEIDDILRKVGDRFVDLVFPALEFPTESGQDVKTSLYVTDWDAVSDFLNETYFAAMDIGVELPIWTYGIYWNFKNERTGEYLKKSRPGREFDDRPFEVLGVSAGDVLIAQRIR